MLIEYTYIRSLLTIAESFTKKIADRWKFCNPNRIEFFGINDIETLLLEHVVTDESDSDDIIFELDPDVPVYCVL